MVSVLVMLTLEIPLNLSNILIASIAIGICVDDTFTSSITLIRVLNSTAMLRPASSTPSSRLVVRCFLTTVVLVLGLSSYLGGTLTSLVHFGLLVNICVVLGVVF